MTKMFAKRPAVLLCVAVVILMLAAAAILMPSLHADGPLDYTITFQIPVTKAITGTPGTASTFTFNIAANALTPDAPLPASRTCTVSGAGSTKFGAITYTDVGRYYYDITETDGGVAGYTYDGDTYIACVEVTNNDTDDGYDVSLYTVWKNSIVHDDEEKLDSIIFTNVYEALPGSLTLSNHVAGQLADKKLGFTFTVTFSDDTYSHTDADKGNITGGTGTITLRHGESIIFPDLPADVTYTINQTNGAAYTTTVDNNGTPVNGKQVTGTVGEDESVDVAYLNTLTYVPVVGLSMTTLPFILLGVLAVGGAAFVITKKIRSR